MDVLLYKEAQTAKNTETEYNSALKSREDVLKVSGSVIKTPYHPPVIRNGKHLVVYLFFKRAFDIFGSIMGLILLSPLILIIALIIRKEDGGRAFYKQERVGHNGKKIGIYKFRSMKEDADDVEQTLTPAQLQLYKTEFKVNDDPRITKIGKKLRKTSLDELPQMLNILKGELSIVGPRPLVTDEIEHYGVNKEYFLSCKPGLTGYWQAYARNDATYKTGRRQQMELYYIDNRGFCLDIKIIFKTIITVLSRRGHV